MHAQTNTYILGFPVTEGSERQTKMEAAGCEIIGGALTNLQVKGQIEIATLTHRLRVLTPQRRCAVYICAPTHTYTTQTEGSDDDWTLVY